MEPTTTTPQQPQQPQWQPVTAPLTPKELAATMRAILRDTRRVGRAVGRDVWDLMLVATMRDARAFLRQPPRWFRIAVVVLTLLAVIFCAISLRNLVLYHLH